MKTNTLNRLSITIGIAGVLAFIGAGWLHMESKKNAVLDTRGPGGGSQPNGVPSCRT